MNDHAWQAVRFIGETIQPIYKRPPMFSKKPEVPDGFTWEDESWLIMEMISTWFSFERKGRMSKNMRPQNLQKASQRGSWGVGRTYFRVRVEGGRVFNIYYDRAPKDVDDRSGEWIIWRELKSVGREPDTRGEDYPDASR